MNRIVELIAPKSALGWALKPMAFVVAIISMNVAIRLILFGELLYELWFIALIVTLVALPFVIPILALIAHMHRLQTRLARLAATDMLTGLPNRRAFFDTVEAVPPDRLCDTLLMIDIDHFKRVNDTYGHAVGDLCLKELGRFLRQMVRQTDIVARMGGEEFAALLRGVAPQEAMHIADRIAEGARIAPAVGAEPLLITASVGLAPRCPGTRLDEVIQMADLALYRAKQAGRARSLIEAGPKPAAGALPLYNAGLAPMSAHEH